jgi:hypothetical protein
MDYGPCIGTMRSFAAAKTSGPVFRIGTGRINEKKTGISVDAVSSLIYSTARYKFTATYVGYSFQAQEVRKKTTLLLCLLLFLFLSPFFFSSHSVFYSPCTPSVYFLFLLLHLVFVFNNFFSFFSSPPLLLFNLPLFLLHLLFLLS